MLTSDHGSRTTHTSTRFSASAFPPACGDLNHSSMRTLLVLAFAALPFVPAMAASGDLSSPPRGGVNSRVSQRTIALNQPVRVEFSTLPRQVEGVDVKLAVNRALDASRLAGKWRLLGEPAVTEHEKTRVVSVSYSLLPRQTGSETALPKVPLTWLAGEQVAEFGLVAITPTIQIGNESKDLPKEVTGVGGFLWGGSITEANARLKPEQIVARGGEVVANAQPGLDLVYRGGALAEAVLTVSGMPLEPARDSFLGRWGMPQVEKADEIAWILGWTSITAKPSADRSGTVITLRREDIQAALDQSTVTTRVFDVLDGSTARPAPLTPEQAAEQRTRDAEREAQRLLDKHAK